MKSSQRRHFFVGIFVILGIFIFILTIYLVGKKENIFGSPFKISAIFYDVQGLREGDNVRLSGIDIGTVSGLSFISDNRVFVEMSLESEAVAHINKDSHVTIGSEGLMGSKVVMIIPGTETDNPVARHDTLESVEQVSIDDILVEVNTSSKNIAVITDQLVSITKKIDRGDGIFGKIFTDTTLTQNLDDATENISFITRNLQDLTKTVQEGKGIVGKLFADTVLTAELDGTRQDLNAIAANLRDITAKISAGEGVFGRMFTDTSMTKSLYESSKNLQATTKSLSRFTEKLSGDSSALNMFINDPTFADSLNILLQKIDVGVVEVTEAAEAVQRNWFIRAFSKKKKEK